MAINRSVDPKPVSVAEAQLARVRATAARAIRISTACSTRPVRIAAATLPTPCICCAAFMAAIPA